MQIIPANPGFHTAVLTWDTRINAWEVGKQPILGWSLHDDYTTGSSFAPRVQPLVEPRPVILDPSDHIHAIITPDGFVYLTDGSGTFDSESEWLEDANKKGLSYMGVPRE